MHANPSITMNDVPLQASADQRWTDHAHGVAWGTIALAAVILGGYVSLIAGLVFGGLTLVPGAMLSVLLLYLSFTVAHEAGHGNIAHEVTWMKPVERALGWCATLPFLIVPFGAFSKLHDYHHAFTNDPDGDPDYSVAQHTGPSVIPHALVIPLVYMRLVATRFAQDPVVRGTHKTSFVYYLVTLTLMTSLILGGYGAELLWIGFVPLFCASFVLALLFDWIPHWPARNQGRYQNTRTYLFPGLKYLTLGQNYHHVHHLYPRVPWYKYESVFENIRPELEAKQAPIEELFSKHRPGLLQSPFARRPVDQGRSHTLTLPVASLRRDTFDSVVITFETPGFDFKAGQYVTLSKRIGGENVTRCYSICESPASGKLAVGVKRVPGGRMSTYLNDSLRVGDRLSVAGPFGDFFYDDSDQGTRGISRAQKRGQDLVLIAGGSGITPLLAILQTALDSNSKTNSRTSKTNPNTKIHLIYANRSVDDVMFRERLHELSARHADRLVITSVYEKPPAGWTGASGYITARMLKSFFKKQKVKSDARYYICGPGPMKQVVVAALRERKVARNKIFIEEFALQAPAAMGPVHRVNIALADGAEHTLDVAENQTVLQAANQQGVAIPHACGVGQCGCCMMRVKSGAVELAREEPPGLLAGERARGLTLACQAKPRSSLALAAAKN